MFRCPLSCSLTRWPTALGVGIASEASFAGAHWVVGDHLAHSVQCASPGTRIHADLVTTCTVVRTVRVGGALRTARVIRVAKVSLEALALARTDWKALSVEATGCVIAWPPFFSDWSHRSRSCKTGRTTVCYRRKLTRI